MLRLIHVDGGVRALGGQEAVLDAALKRCLQRVACLAKLAIKTVEAEFPSFEVINAFACFKLPRRARVSPDVAEQPDHMNYLRRLAQIFDLDVDTVRQQYVILRPYALKEFKDTLCTNMEAWQKAARPPKYVDRSQLLFLPHHAPPSRLEYMVPV